MKFLRQLKQCFIATVAILALVFLLFLFGVIPYDASIFTNFLIGSILLIIGQTIFLVAIDESIIGTGRNIGAKLFKLKKVWILLIFGFLFGLVSTIAEPDVQVLIGELLDVNPFIGSFILLSIFGIGSGFFVSFALFRILKNISLKWVLLVLYSIIITLCFFVPESYVGLAFDAGGVATGSITVPFLLAVIIGICAIRSGSKKEDSFGAVAIASTGPIIAVLILGVVFGAPEVSSSYQPESASFWAILAEQAKDVGWALSPLLLTFIITQFALLKLPKKQALKVFVGFIVASFGLICFLTGIYFGFSSMGNFIGVNLITNAEYWFILLFGVFIGSLLVFTDPATIVLVEQVEEVTAGFLKKTVVFTTLAIGVALAVLLAFVHVIYQVSFYYLLIPIYVVCIVLNFIIPKIFTSIAFDGGGIASGTMVVAFILPICVGMSSALGQDIMLYAFGVAGMVATTPILTVQILGLIFMIKTSYDKKKDKKEKQILERLAKEHAPLSETISCNGDILLDKSD